MLKSLKNLDELLLAGNKRIGAALALALTFVHAHVALPDSVCACLILRVLQLVDHLENEALLLVIEVALYIIAK